MSDSRGRYLVGVDVGGTEVYRPEEIDLRVGDRIRRTPNDAGVGLVNSRTAEVVSFASGQITFQLEDRRKLKLGKGDPQTAPSRPCWPSAVHAVPEPHRRCRDRRHGGAVPAPDDTGPGGYLTVRRGMGQIRVV